MTIRWIGVKQQGSYWHFWAVATTWNFRHNMVFWGLIGKQTTLTYSSLGWRKLSKIAVKKKSIYLDDDTVKDLLTQSQEQINQYYDQHLMWKTLST